MINRLQEIMDKAVNENLVAGVNLLVNKDGREIYLESGKADIENNVPIRRDTIFRLYSQTKPVTAAAAMILMERGEIDLFQPVSDFLPAYAKTKIVSPDGKIVPCPGPLLVWHLLNMTSGLMYPGNDTEAGKHSATLFEDATKRIGSNNEMTTIEFAERMAEGPLAFVPGTSWAYGTSADVLGAVIEKASGEKFSEFLRKEIFDPLGMNDTGFWVEKEKQPRLSKVYETVYGTWPFGIKKYIDSHLAINNSADHTPGFESGGAGLCSTLDDYMKFARMLLNYGELNGKRILKPKTVEYFTTGELQPQCWEAFSKWISLEGHSYGNFMRVCKNPSMAGMLTGNGEYGWDGWLGMYFANLPEENMTILMGTQKKDAGTFSLTRKLRNVLLSNLD